MKLSRRSLFASLLALPVVRAMAGTAPRKRQLDQRYLDFTPEQARAWREAFPPSGSYRHKLRPGLPVETAAPYTILIRREDRT